MSPAQSVRHLPGSYHLNNPPTPSPQAHVRCQTAAEGGPGADSPTLGGLPLSSETLRFLENNRSRIKGLRRKAMQRNATHRVAMWEFQPVCPVIFGVARPDCRNKIDIHLPRIPCAHFSEEWYTIGSVRPEPGVSSTRPTKQDSASSRSDSSSAIQSRKYDQNGTRHCEVV